MTRLLARLKPVLAWLDLRDLFVFGGLTMVGYGIALVYPPAAWSLCGLAILWLGLR